MYMHTIMSSSGRDCVLIILLHFYVTRLFKVICSGWVNITPPHNLHIGRRANLIPIHNFLAIYPNNSWSKNC